ncbi:MAG: hypothetical protein U9Q24_02955 [Candidatus Ratteibacteria bacterium]|nr:hypothetical protein [Candidatus Ratteibacteria bacterium]
MEGIKIVFEKFKLWSERNSETKKILNPDLGMREWDALSNVEKQKIWHYLKSYFLYTEKSDIKTYIVIEQLNEAHKYHSYAQNFLIKPTLENARCDFEEIFLKQNKDVVFQLLALFSREIIEESTGKMYPKSTEETDEEYIKRKTNLQFEEFDHFKGKLNDIFEQFGINIVLTRVGFVVRQDQKIIDGIYEPVLNFLSDQKWEEVNRELKDAFKDYQTKNASGYSSSITHAISALEAFLQLSIYGETGKGTLGGLITEALKKKNIPDDTFSRQIFSNFKLILTQERKKTSDAHPKKYYANEKNARLVLNLAMIFLQHCIQSR